ncbi:MAG: tetratricopeptide repeat protein [Acidobacteria bacterium]|nr:tetratricopeptide repeat protein [Acidobacteriota bacterium]
MTERDLENELAAVLSGEKPLTELMNISAEQMGFIAELAHLYFQEGRYQEARTLFEGLLSLNQHEPYYSHALGAVFHRMDNSDLALRYYQHALKLDRNRAETWGNMGELLLAQGQGEKALEYLEKAEQLYAGQDPGSTKRQRIQALLRQQRHPLA